MQVSDCRLTMAETDPPTNHQAAEPIAEAEASRADESAAGGEEDYSQHFAPLVELSEVETKTGEEDEEVLFKIRAKLFRFDKSLSEWKERGTGDVRLLQHKESRKIRLLMRREKTLKICLNHYVNVNVEMTENVGSDRSWVFHAVDYADGEQDDSMLAIRFANSKNAGLFKDNYDKARVYMRALREGSRLPDNLFTKQEDDSTEKKENSSDTKDTPSATASDATSTKDSKSVQSSDAAKVASDAAVA